jgi:dienelactone hydrolase
LRTIEWAKGNRKFRKIVDWKAKVGIMGFSMGGMATYISASNAKQVKKLNIGAAVSIHPHYKKRYFKSSKVPIMFLAG